MPNTNERGAQNSGDERNLEQLIQECLACGVVVADSCGEIQCLNEHAAKLFGTDLRQSSADASGLPCRPSLKILPQPVADAIARSLSKGQAIHDLELAIEPGPKKLRLSTVLMSEATTARTLIAIVHDVTAVDSFDGNLRRLGRLASVGTLAAGMAHEIKNALVAVRTFIDLLIEKNPAAEMAEMASREVRRINSLASQMLKVSSSSKPVFETIHLHDVLRHALGLVQIQLHKKEIRLSQDFGVPNDSVRGDAYQLEQAFVNLFFNGIEAMDPGGALSVTTEMVATGEVPRTADALVRGPSPEGKAADEGVRGPQKKPLIRVRVGDTGAGIAPEHLSRLFDTFFTTKATGTGLGLTITRRIIQEHDGSIDVQSEVGRGTEFTVYLPIA